MRASLLIALLVLAGGPAAAQQVLCNPAVELCIPLPPPPPAPPGG